MCLALMLFISLGLLNIKNADAANIPSFVVSSQGIEVYTTTTSLVTGRTIEVIANSTYWNSANEIHERAVWISSDPSIATVSNEDYDYLFGEGWAKINCLRPGTVTITVSHRGAVRGSITLIISEYSPPGSTTSYISSTQTISCGRFHYAYIDLDGTLWFEGYKTIGTRNYGGLNKVINKIADNVISVTSSTYNHRGVYYGGVTIFYIDKDGVLWGIGDNTSYGILGIGTRERELFTTPQKILENVTYVSSNEDATYAITSDNSLWFWGMPAYIDSMFASESDLQLRPKKIMDGVISVSSSIWSVAVIKTDGTLWTWGNELASRSFGDGSTSTRSQPVKVMDNVIAVDITVDNGMAIKSDYSLWVWGDNSYGQIGNGRYDPAWGYRYTAPVKIMDSVTAISAGPFDSCYSLAVTSDGKLWGWGQNSELQLGGEVKAGNTSDTADFVLRPTPLAEKIVDVTASSGQWIALKSDGTIWLKKENYSFSIDYNIFWAAKDPFTGLRFLKEGIMFPQPRANLTPSPQTPSSTRTATPTPSTVFVNGSETQFEAYLINSNNYFKLRDLAYVLNGTNKQFSIGYDNATRAITMISGQSYLPEGGEMARGDGSRKSARLNADINISKDSRPVQITAYMINGYNFVMLRDVMRLFDVYVGYNNATRNITIDTSRPYSD